MSLTHNELLSRADKLIKTLQEKKDALANEESREKKEARKANPA